MKGPGFMIAVAQVLMIVPTCADEIDWDEVGRLRAAQAEIGFAEAATAVCAKLKIRTNGIAELAASLSPANQTELFTNKGQIEVYAEDASKTFSLAGDSACDIAINHTTKAKFKLLEPGTP